MLDTCDEQYSNETTASFNIKLELFHIKNVKIDVPGGFWNTKREIQQNVLPIVFTGI